jgi:hypothetical protein
MNNQKSIGIVKVLGSIIEVIETQVLVIIEVSKERNPNSLISIA